MPRPSTIYRSMRATTLTQMRRSRLASGRGSAVSSKIAWLWSSLTPSVSWSTVLSFRRMPTWLTRQRRRERRRRRGLRAALPRGFDWCSRAHSMPPSNTSHRSSGDTCPLSTLSHRGQLGLLFLHRASRRFGCRSRGCAQIFPMLQLQIDWTLRT